MDVRHAFPVEKSGREVPAELSADGVVEMWSPVAGGTVHELDRPNSWKDGDDVKRLGFRESDVYR